RPRRGPRPVRRGRPVLDPGPPRPSTADGRAPGQRGLLADPGHQRLGTARPAFRYGHRRGDRMKTTSTAPPLPADLEELLRRLRPPHIRRHAPEVGATAKAQRWEPTEVLKALFAEEVAGRERSALATRRAAAGFPTGKTFDAWQPEVSSIPAPTQQALRTLEWVHRRENLVVCGPSGTGKTFLLEALG